MQVLQGPVPAVDAPNPLHHDEVRLLREDSRSHLQARHAEAQERVHQRRTADCHVCSWVHW